MPLRMRDSRPHAKTKLPFLGSTLPEKGTFLLCLDTPAQCAEPRPESATAVSGHGRREHRDETQQSHDRFPAQAAIDRHEGDGGALRQGRAALVARAGAPPARRPFRRLANRMAVLL